MTRLAILSAAIGQYHDARYRAAASAIKEVVVIASTTEGEFPEFIAQRLGDYRTVNLYRTRSDYSSAVQSRSVGGRMVECLREVNPDILAIAGWSAPEGLAALTWARKSGIPTIVMSESQQDDAPRSWARELVKSRVIAQFDAALVGGPAHADYLEQMGFSRDHVAFGYNAVDNDHFQRGAETAKRERQAMLRKHGLPDRYLLASGRFIPKKNFKTLIAAYARARTATTCPPHLVILGDGPGRADLEATVADLNLEGFVHLPGFRKYGVLPVFYGLAEGFCHVSMSEQWGLVVNEAMASGVPVLVSNRCGSARTLLAAGQGGIVVDPSLDAVADGISALIALEPAQRLAMGETARAAVAEWGPSRFASGIKTAIEIGGAARRKGAIAPWDMAVLDHLQQKVRSDVE